MTDNHQEPINEGLWAAVAAIKRKHPHGPGGVETRVGTRQFRGGTKVYIAGCFPGTCDAVVAIGLHRHSRKWITCCVDARHVENFRVRLVYHPAVIDRIRNDERCRVRTKEEADMGGGLPELAALVGEEGV